MPRSIVIKNNFAPEARALRAHFDQAFRDPRSTSRERFVWDFWHVPGQYTALRTPAWEYFPEDLYRRFHERLVLFGRRTLGCHDVSPPWLSCYVEGCRQEWHGDLPHGPWAFVFSLTPWTKRRFSGGETLILRDDVLDFWDGFKSTRSIEEDEILRGIEPRFGRLVVFDPRLPHAVRRVEGTLDPREGRLVIHGWFVQPRPFVSGPLNIAELGDHLPSLGPVISRFVERGLSPAGLISIGFTVQKNGTVAGAKVLSDTTRTPRAHEGERRKMVRTALAQIRAWRFSRRRAAAAVTLPIVLSR